MSEIINIHIGEAGIRTGLASWQLFCIEHGINLDGQMPINYQYEGEEQLQQTFFKEDKQANQVPRCVFLDLDPVAIQEIIIGPQRNQFRLEQLISGKEDSGNNFARGRYTLGKEFIDICLDRIRRQADDCQNLQGFIIHHSVGGGTGSGLGSLLLERLSVDYGKKTKLTYDIFPSRILSKSIVEPYNTVLASHSLHEHSDVSIVLDNEAIYDICRLKQDIVCPTFQDLNHFIAQLISQQTVSLRFGGCFNSNLAEIKTNMVPYPTIHYLLSSLSIIKKHQDLLENTPMISEQLFQQENMVAKCDINSGKYIACSVIYRGDYIPKYISSSIAKIKTNRTVKFVDWCPTGFKVGINYHEPAVVPESNMEKVSRIASMLANNTAIGQIFEKYSSKFDVMFHKRAFFHHYLREGMEEGEFLLAKENLESIIGDYTEAGEENVEEVVEIEEEKKQ